MDKLSGIEQIPNAIVSPVDRRSAPRRDASKLQIVVAPYAGGPLPNETDFQPVRGRDISTGGIAFYWPVEPNFRQMAIGVGGPSATQFVIAKVVRTARQVNSGEYLVAGQFEREIEV